MKKGTTQTISISPELHRKIKMKAVRLGKTVRQLAEEALRLSL